MTSNTHLPDKNCSWREWNIPISCENVTLQQVLDSANHLAAAQSDVPIIVQLLENPKFNIPGINLFEGAVNLHDHDCIHAILGRGMLPHDEAFTIGFTMGSTNRVTSAEMRLYELASKYLYPGPYKFKQDDIQIFKDGVHLGFVSDCRPLDKINYDAYMDWKLSDIRSELGIEVDLLTAYYRIEQRRYPTSIESQRLLK